MRRYFNHSTQLPDIIGEIVCIKSTISDPLEEKNRVMVTIKMDSDDTVTLSLFDSQAVTFHKQLEAMRVAMFRVTSPSGFKILDEISGVDGEDGVTNIVYKEIFKDAEQLSEGNTHPYRFTKSQHISL